MNNSATGPATALTPLQAAIFGVANTKGGVGKTTVALNLAISLAILHPNEVALVNGDRQNTADIAVANRAAGGTNPSIPCFHFPDGPQLREQVKLLRTKYRYIVIDVGGRDSSAMRATLMLADVVVVPFLPRSFDAWAMDEMAALLKDAYASRDGLTALAMLNLADPGENSTDNADAAGYVATIPEFLYLDTPLRRRKAFADASGAGLAVSEAKRRDPKAIGEFDKFVSDLLTIAADPEAFRASMQAKAAAAEAAAKSAPAVEA